MKKYTPYVFPLIVVGIILILVFRWYSLRTKSIEYSLLGEGVSIENLSQEEMIDSLTGVGDYETVQLEGATEADSGVVRYELKDDKIRFSVMANLPESESSYRVWLKSLNGTAMREVFVLEAGKGGYIGSAALPAELLPFEVIVSQNGDARMADQQSLLRGTVQAEQDGESTEGTVEKNGFSSEIKE